MMDETTPGRNPVEIVKLRQPACGNTFGVAPCTASGTGDEKCYNTNATCLDLDNYRSSVEALIVQDDTLKNDETFSPSPAARSSDLFFAVDLYVPSDAEGVIWEAGGTGAGTVLVFDSGNLVFRSGNGTAGSPSDAAILSVSAADLFGKYITLYGEIDLSLDKVTVWWQEDEKLAPTKLGETTATNSFGSWAGGDPGAVGRAESSAPGGYSTAYNSTIDELRLYYGLTAPDMTVDFEIPIYFSTGDVAEQEIDGAPYIIPALQSTSTIPTRINLSAADPDAKGLGTRASYQLTLKDHPHTDRIVDPYLSERTFDPFNRGTFWTKWLKRNPYRQTIDFVVYTGYSGQALSDMVSREAILTKINGPDSSGIVRVEGKDIITKLEGRKAKIPEASPGELWKNIDDTQTNIAVVGATVNDYPSSGTLRIGDELIKYTDLKGDEGKITFLVSERGSDGTTAASHDAEEKVQECVRYEGLTVDEIVRAICVRKGIRPSKIDAEGTFKAESSRHLGAYTVEAILTTPIDADQLLADLQAEIGFMLWWDEREALVKMRAFRGIETPPDTIDDVSNIVADSFSVWELPRSRISQLWFYYKLRSPVLSLDEENFSGREIVADLPSEGDDRHGEPSIKERFSRWIDNRTLAFISGFRTVTRYSEIPRRAKFRLDAKDRQYWVGDVVYISHPSLVDVYGVREIVQWTIVSAEEVRSGDLIEYEAEDTELYGRIYEYMESDAPDYPDGDGSFTNAYYGDADGLLPDDTTAATYG